LTPDDLVYVDPRRSIAGGERLLRVETGLTEYPEPLRVLADFGREPSLSKMRLRL
jgi:hypothetical protein